MIEKFQEIKTLVSEGYYPQAQDECDNGSNMTVEAKGLLLNIHSKLIDKFGADELLNDLYAAIENV